MGSTDRLALMVVGLSDPLDTVPMNQHQAYCVARMLGCLEGIVSSGVLHESVEMEMRLIIAETLKAFGLPACWETETDRSVQ
jgi:hypothetical protein